ncbi:MAG: histidine triad nucleotide-binding protein [Candidatus Hinthialibacter sp.]
MPEEDCIFCKIAKREINASVEYEDDDVVAFQDLNPQAPVHLLVIPKRHIAKIGDLGPEDADILFKLIDASNKLAQKFNMAEEGYRLVINSGDNGGQTVYHLHVHVLGGRFMRWPPG